VKAALVILNQKPESQKFTHDEVGYEEPSTHRGEQCKNCEHFIAPTGSTPAACEGVQRPIAANAWCHRFEEMKMDHAKKHAHHGFTDTHIKHHTDGSATVKHVHHEGPHKDVEHGVPSLDHVHDSLQAHLGMPNPGEAAADAGDHGVAPPEAAAAGLPTPGAAAPAGA
jgi:hypothetical protein